MPEGIKQGGTPWELPSLHAHSLGEGQGVLPGQGTIPGGDMPVGSIPSQPRNLGEASTPCHAAAVGEIPPTPWAPGDPAHRVGGPGVPGACLVVCLLLWGELLLLQQQVQLLHAVHLWETPWLW